jgi:hypothetical protein
MLKLEVRKIEGSEVFKDIIRVHKLNRKNIRGELIETGLVCRVSVPSTSKCTYAILRGNDDGIDKEKTILIDESLRDKLGVELGKEYKFIFEKTSRWWGWWRWAWSATDPGYQISIRIAMISIGISIILGLLGLFPLFQEYFKGAIPAVL